MSMLSDLKQLRFPPEFRIAAIPWPSELEPLLKRLVESNDASQTEEYTKFVEQQFHLLADIGTSLWRLKRRMPKPGGGNQPSDGMRIPYRHLESAWDALTQAGVEIIVKTGEIFYQGDDVKVVSFQPVPGHGCERIIETIKPTIYFKGQHIQMGEVIVERPDSRPNPPGEGDGHSPTV